MTTRSRFYICGASSVAIAALSWPAAALAQEEDAPIVVTATIDDPAQPDTAPPAALDRQAIETLAPVSVTSRLSLVPGVFAFEKGGPGGGSYVSIRGGEPNFAPVTINGVRVDDPLNSSGGGLDFTRLDPKLVERLAILRGPRSTVYGADALSGIVAVELGAQQGSSVGGFAGLGTEGRYEVGAHAAFSGVTVAASHTDTDGLYSGTRLRRDNAMMLVSPDLGPELSLDLVAFYGASESLGFPEDSGGPRLAVLPDPEAREGQQFVLGGAFAVQASEDVTLQLRGSYARSDFESSNPGIPPGVLDGVPPIITDSAFERVDTAASATWRPLDLIQLEAGASFVHETGTSVGEIDFGFAIPTEFTLSRDMPGIFAIATLGPDGGIQATAAARIDWPEGGKARLSPRLGVSAPVTQNVELFARYAEGFKRPSLFALGYPLIANPDLEDERSTVYDAGVALKSADEAWRGSLTLFRAEYSNLIDFDPNLFTNVNRSRVNAGGVELAVSGAAGPLSIDGAITHQTSESRDGALLRFRPEWTGRVLAGWAVSETLRLAVDAEIVGAFNDSSVPTGFVRNSGYETIGAEVSWDASEAITVTGSVRNLFDADFVRTVGFAEPGTNAFLSVRARY